MADNNNHLVSPFFFFYSHALTIQRMKLITRRLRLRSDIVRSFLVSMRNFGYRNF